MLYAVTGEIVVMLHSQLSKVKQPHGMHITYSNKISDTNTLCLNY